MMATTHDYAPQNNSKENKLPVTNDQFLKNENLIVSPQEHEAFDSENTQTSYYPYLQSMSPMIGVLFNANDITDGNAVLYRVVYLVPKVHSPQLEVGVDLVSDSTGFFHFAYRWISAERSPFRPYFKIGASHNLIPNEKLASFTNTNNYFVLSGIGLEDLLSPPMSVRFEAHLLIGIKSISIGLSFGYSWGW